MDGLQFFDRSEITDTDRTPIEVLLQVGEDGRVSARSVYEFLGLHPDNFAKWSKTNITESEFCESGEDFSAAFLEEDAVTPSGAPYKRKSIDYRLSVSLAKEICMLSRTERGDQARKYFIKVEKTLQRVVLASRYAIPQTLPDALRLAADYAEKNQQLQAEIEVQKPKVEFAEAVTASDNSISVNELAKIIKQNGVDTGRNRLMEWLRNNGYLIKQKGDEYNLPTYRSAKMGLLEVDSYTYSSRGVIYTNYTPKVTRKGQAYFINKFCYETV